MSEPVYFPGISTRAWEHPADRAALQSLRRVPGFDLIVRKIYSLTSERPLRVITQGSAIEVGPKQYAQVNAIYEDVLKTFDAPKRYDLFVSQNPVINAGAVGLDDPFMVLNSATVNQLEEAQLRSVIGHELAHIMSGHVLYKTMLRLMLRAGIVFFRMPLTGLAMLPVLAALLEWDRKSELSADRAGLLACQDPDVVRGALLRIAGGVGDGANVEAFREQARRFEESGSALDSVLKVLAMLRRRHPFPVQRIGEIDRWVEGGEYDQFWLANIRSEKTTLKSEAGPTGRTRLTVTKKDLKHPPSPSQSGSNPPLKTWSRGPIPPWTFCLAKTASGQRIRRHHQMIQGQMWSHSLLVLRSQPTQMTWWRTTMFRMTRTRTMNS